MWLCVCVCVQVMQGSLGRTASCCTGGGTQMTQGEGDLVVCVCVCVCVCVVQAP